MLRVDGMVLHTGIKCGKQLLRFLVTEKPLPERLLGQADSLGGVVSQEVLRDRPVQHRSYGAESPGRAIFASTNMGHALFFCSEISSGHTVGDVPDHVRKVRPL